MDTLDATALQEILTSSFPGRDVPIVEWVGHDTVTVLALDHKGSLGGVCTTSGLAHKLPGRVGDSPLVS